MAKILDRPDAEHTVEVFREMHAAGFRFKQNGQNKTLIGQVAAAMHTSPTMIRGRIASMRANYPDLAAEIDALDKAPPSFDIEEAASTDEPIENLLDAIERRHQRKVDAQQAAIPVRIHTPGPIAVAIIGDIHIDDPGCAMGPLRRDTELIANTEGMYAIAVGDYRNNWIGRLTKLWANQETTQKQALRLIEWWFGACGNKLIAAVQGNHDAWHTEGGDAVEIMHRLSGQASLYGEPAYRLDLRLPSGANALVHVRHDFSGSSQFNAAHGQVRETLFGYRDHIIACGDRHHSGYIPIWHNDPARLCHGMRVGCYKDFDPFAAEKGFRWANWSRTMVAIIDPAKADDPVEFITVRFSVEAAVEELTRRREAWQRDNLQTKDRRQGAAPKRRAGNDDRKRKR